MGSNIIFNRAAQFMMSSDLTPVSFFLMDKLGRLRTELGTQIFCIIPSLYIKYLIEAHKNYH